MKKLILAICLIVGASFASFAGIQMYNPGFMHDGTGFTFDSDGSYGLLFGLVLERPFDTPIAFGYYHLSDPTTFYSGSFTGNDSDYFSSIVGLPGCTFVDINTGYLGEFKSGDIIGIWIQDGNGTIYTSLDTGREDVVFMGTSHWNGLYNFFDLGSSAPCYLHGIEMAPPVGEPLPGVMAALAIGGCAFLGRKIRKSIKNKQ